MTAAVTREQRPDCPCGHPWYEHTPLGCIGITYRTTYGLVSVPCDCQDMDTYPWCPANEELTS